jgi:hypothetical protein
MLLKNLKSSLTATLTVGLCVTAHSIFINEAVKIFVIRKIKKQPRRHEEQKVANVLN